MATLHLDLSTDLGCWRNISIHANTLFSVLIGELRDIQALCWCPGGFFFLFFLFFWLTNSNSATNTLSPRTRALPTNLSGTIHSLEFLLQVNLGKPICRHSSCVGHTRWTSPCDSCPHPKSPNPCPQSMAICHNTTMTPVSVYCHLQPPHMLRPNVSTNWLGVRPSGKQGENKSHIGMAKLVVCLLQQHALSWLAVAGKNWDKPEL